MPGLHELQCRMRDAMLDGQADKFDQHVATNSLTVARKIGIYRNNIFTNLREALRTLFPVTERLVGTEFFYYMSEQFIRRYPSPAGDLNCYGAELGNFIAEFTPAASLTYLPDVARLEWQAHRVYHARDCTTLDYQRLAAVDPDDYANLVFQLNPATSLFASDYPVHRIWQVNQPGYDGDETVDLGSGAVTLLISRREAGVELEMLNPGVWTLLNAIARQENFNLASEQALAAEPDLDLAGCLAGLIAQSTLVDFVLPENSDKQFDTTHQEVSP